MLQADFTVQVQSKSALTTSDIKVTNGQVMSVTPVSGTADSYDVAVASKTKSGTVAVSTIASAAVAASTITVDVDTTAPQVRVSTHCCNTLCTLYSSCSCCHKSLTTCITAGFCDCTAEPVSTTAAAQHDCCLSDSTAAPSLLPQCINTERNLYRSLACLL